ncbi:DUF6081 family protein [Streptomyces sp. MST-110588]|uniref:DUF6081 family protein n=1 Tax=Streptomyces sp. MST-110588 TaxID=2833628 RepID=UPI001F5D0E65|nr:DUF6081 family protein [Streptomyces sp. MST-110588]UNO43004.1 hypothetical protein KGS77_30240 [Streptomyces sp. MST-110588]
MTRDRRTEQSSADGPAAPDVSDTTGTEPVPGSAAVAGAEEAKETAGQDAWTYVAGRAADRAPTLEDQTGQAVDQTGGTTGGSTSAAADAASEMAGHRVIWEDDFSKGFLTEGPRARWIFLPFGSGVGLDGKATTSRRGLQVVSGGTNSVSHQPAFTLTLGQNDPSKLPGNLDHVKWLANVNVKSTGGVLGFDTAPGSEVSYETWMSGVSYGTDGHPFGNAVDDAQDDLRLASMGFSAQDLESGVAFDFYLTNKSVYVFYERLPNNRAQLGNYAAFLYTIPVARRSPRDEHHCRISYDRSRGLARWFLDGKEVLRVDRIGHRLDSRRFMMLDHGGVEQTVQLKQLELSLGLFTTLDGGRPGRAGSGLVRLTTEAGHYFDPAVGEPTPERFRDEASAPGSRLWGQGAGLNVRRVRVTRRRTSAG